MKKEDVNLKATEDGLVIGISEEQIFPEVKAALKKKLEDYVEMLEDSSIVIIDVGERTFSSKEKKEVTKIIKKYSGGDPKTVTWSQPKPKGQVISMETREEIKLAKNKDKKENISLIDDEIAMLEIELPEPDLKQFEAQKEEKPVSSFSDDSIEIEDTSEAVETKAQEDMDDQSGEAETLLIKRTLRSGQGIHFDGNVVVLGDVNPGAEIIASGNVIVMGFLRGVVHAGAMGNRNAIVTAFRLQPTQLRIANHITRAPDGDYIPPEQPEIARIKDGVVMIEMYHTNQEKQTKIG